MPKSITVEALKSYVRKEASYFLDKPNVTSIGVGYKQVGGKATKELCIQFTVGKKSALERLEALGMEALPEKLVVDGIAVPTDVRYDWRPLDKIKALRTATDPVLIAMAEKLRTPEGKARYRRRACTVEPVFGIIKSALGFRQFLLRGLQKFSGEWNLVCLGYNLKRLHTLSQTATAV